LSARTLSHELDNPRSRALIGAMSRPAHRSLRQLRRRAALSARELAARAGVASNTILNAERGSTPKYATQDAIAAALADVLGEPVDALELWPLPPDDGSLAELVRLYGMGYTTAELGERFAINPSTARRRLLRAGVKLRPKGRRVPLDPPIAA
jgi:transcriptional regulator with XRE-family HTH domain